MELHHLSHNLRLWQMNQKYARQIVRQHDEEQFGVAKFLVG